MRRAARRRWIVLAVTAVLLVLAALQYRHDRANAPGTLLGIDPASIDTVALELPRKPPERYRRHEGHWWREDGERADDGRLEDLAGIAAAPVAGWRSADAFDPARIGLEPPMARLQLDGHTLEFGTTAVTGPLRYVRVGDRIALVPMRYTPRPAARDAERIH